MSFIDMKNFIIKSFFVIEAETADDANQIACRMQESANDLYKNFNKFLIIDETHPIVESNIDLTTRKYIYG